MKLYFSFYIFIFDKFFTINFKYNGFRKIKEMS